MVPVVPGVKVIGYDVPVLAALSVVGVTLRDFIWVPRAEAPSGTNIVDRTAPIPSHNAIL
jgi:hypothetical protein